ncbi:vacuolar cation/proton exchanger 1a [Iris pallida]|uniref:Vacuolar cation/proton exchanger 1a n=1 Tax=Iris pallida TaxID=29817 RepID=A0AAX6FHX6_IRIPA|nr:vacuolar cation/proton exchanger 1a [Iris pallida]
MIFWEYGTIAKSRQEGHFTRTNPSNQHLSLEFRTHGVIGKLQTITCTDMIPPSVLPKFHEHHSHRHSPRTLYFFPRNLHRQHHIFLILLLENILHKLYFEIQIVHQNVIISIRLCFRALLVRLLKFCVF